MSRLTTMASSASAPVSTASNDLPLDMCVVLMTAPSDDVAAVIARTLVDEKLAACVNLLPGLRSIYAWDGKVCDDREVLCIVKTRSSLFQALVERVRALHPYEVPEVVALEVARVSTPYLEWLRASTVRGT